MPDEITTPLASWGGVAAILSALGLGGVLTSQVRAAADPASVDWMTGWPGDV
ncbi:hypothetical protein [Brevundimonas naejangsanensis]|uniref:hypothetical protein n=1 Tax=Brevundimonas naejangsanensis TaxID=588932 RepID=UPI0034D4CD59